MIELGTWILKFLSELDRVFQCHWQTCILIDDRNKSVVKLNSLSVVKRRTRVKITTTGNFNIKVRAKLSTSHADIRSAMGLGSDMRVSGSILKL